MADAAYRLAGKRVWVAGHGGMVGSAVVRRLAHEDCEVLTVARATLDLRRQSAVESWMADVRPDAIVFAAAKVGGIHANSSYPADFLADNLLIETNVIQTAARTGVEKLLFLGSSCIYPKFAAQPMAEEALLTGALEPTNEWYAIAKIAGIKLCQAFRQQHGCDFISAMPTNLYGPNDNYHRENSHVIPALLRKAYEARAAAADHIVVWGNGTPRREFLHVDDLADALIYLLKTYSEAGHINVGSGSDITIGDLARLICEVADFDGAVRFDPSMPDGTPRKLLDGSRLTARGWSPRVGLKEGLAGAFVDYADHIQVELAG